MFGFHKKAVEALATYEVHVAFQGRTPRTVLVLATDEKDALATTEADPGHWFHTLQEPDYVAVTLAA